ncbi:MAG TPA: hypothetical protein VF881_01575 [Polyangiaceae bacterium]
MSESDRTKPPEAGRPADVPDPDAAPTPEELESAEWLRRALDRAESDVAANRDWELLQSIRSAVAPVPLSDERHRRILDASLSPKRTGKVIYLAVGGMASLAAMAAALALVIGQPRQQSPAAVAQARRALAVSRSAADLFPEGIPPTGGTTERVDRIADARAQDLRENRFARWGIR